MIGMKKGIQEKENFVHLMGQTTFDKTPYYEIP